MKTDRNGSVKNFFKYQEYYTKNVQENQKSAKKYFKNVTKDAEKPLKTPLKRGIMKT